VPRISVKRVRVKRVKWDDSFMASILANTPSAVSKAAKALFDGHLVAFPTETVYGLGVDAGNRNSTEKMYSIKTRPLNHPVIVHISNISLLSSWTENVPSYAKLLASKYWPGPMTLILPKASNCGDYLTGGQVNIGIRIPANPVALAILSEFENMGGLGVAAPSANIFGSISPTCARDVELEIGNRLGKMDLIVDGGRCEIGIESTIIDCSNLDPRILRYGAITQEMIEEFLQIKLSSNKSIENFRHSGSFDSHYSPNAELILSSEASNGDGFIALSSYPTPAGAIRLSSPSDLNEYAHNLYSSLRLGDTYGLKKIYAIPPEGNGIAAAINDRLNRASTKLTKI
jgi:L-threonylcarbamoyladenylate synthase